MRIPSLAFAFLLILSSGDAFAQSDDPVLARQWWQRTDLREHIGQTYLQTYLAKTVGLHAEIVADYNRSVTIEGAETIARTTDSFDPRVPERTYGNFTDGRAGFVEALKSVEGRKVPTDHLRDTLQPFTDAEAKPESKNFALSEAASLALLASGSGTLVVLDDNNYFYNVGYQDPIRFSGRSYGASNDRKLFDPGDNDYLQELEAYLGPDNTDPSSFYTIMFDILTNSDSRGIGGLSPEGQVVITDFMTIYTAELDRNHMADLSPTQWAWQSDLAEVTLLTAYGAASGMAVKDGQLIQCSALAYDWKHGIGPRSDIMELARLITRYELTHNPALVFDVIALTPLTDGEVVASVEGDVFRRALTFLNRPEAQASAQANAASLKSAMVALLEQVRADQAAITAFIKAIRPPGDATCDIKGANG